MVWLGTKWCFVTKPNWNILVKKGGEKKTRCKYSASNKNCAKLNKDSNFDKKRTYIPVNLF